MESGSSSDPSSCEEDDRVLDAPDEFFYDCYWTNYDTDRLDSSPSDIPPAANLQRRWLAAEKKPTCFVTGTDPSSSSTKLNSFGERSTMETVDELTLRDFGAIEKDVDVTDQFPVKRDDFEVNSSCVELEKNMDVTDSGRSRFDPLQNGSNSTTSNDEQREGYARPEPTSMDWSLLGLVIKSIEFQISLLISFIKFPPLLISSFLAFIFDPYRTMRRGRGFLLSKIVEFCELVLNDHKPVLEVMRRLVWGLLWAVYVGIILFALLVSALMVSSFVITFLAQEPLVIKENLNFDYTKNSPEAYVPITSCDGIGFDSTCKENTGKIRGLEVNPPNHRTEITVLMTLPESEYNRNLGMFQIRVDFLSASGQILASSRRPCMIRFRSEPIRLLQTFLKIAPLVTGYVSEIQTLNLNLKGFVGKDSIPTACLKIVIEQRAEFRPGAGIPEIYDASLLFKSELAFFKRIIWNWRRTLFVWISMGVFIAEFLFALVFCRPLIIPRTGQRTQQRDRTPSSNNR